ncbi:MliC family protein [Chelativorans sp. YIM 93263]|uniref:MliC family protein n=1 Tax=Chelativorans sp. YIM 93263 TaxID=2906648 RepID=UPI0023785C09|nr:MliC family protein [Chelativorans sp. YIM 93263]
MRFLFLIAFLTASTVAARSIELAIELPEAGEISAERIDATYDCGSQAMMSVEYVNAGPVSLAVFAHEGEPVIASNVLSASGARYAAGPFIWWTKGPQASLYDLRNGEDAPPVLECTEQR